MGITYNLYSTMSRDGLNTSYYNYVNYYNTLKTPEQAVANRSCETYMIIIIQEISDLAIYRYQEHMHAIVS